MKLSLTNKKRRSAAAPSSRCNCTSGISVLRLLVVLLTILRIVAGTVLCAVLGIVLAAVIVFVLLLLVLAILVVLVIIVFRHFPYLLIVLMLQE